MVAAERVLGIQRKLHKWASDDPNRRFTDLHNLACPMIRYVTGDLAVAHDNDAPCPCGRNLERIGPIEGRVTETLRDGHGNAVGGLVFNILFGVLGLADKIVEPNEHRLAAKGKLVTHVGSDE